MHCAECCQTVTFFCLSPGTSFLWAGGGTRCGMLNPLPHASDSPPLKICEISGFQQRQVRVIQQCTERLLVYQNNLDFLPLLVICSLVSWLEANHSLSSLFITVTQSGVSGPQWVLINDSSWLLKAFRRMIFQFWAGIQTATQKYHSTTHTSLLLPSPLILYPQW